MSEMNDKELADKVVALGIGYSDHDCGISEYDTPIPEYNPLTAGEFVREWRVAGAVMEKYCNRFGCITIDYTEMPRAIIVACVKAFTEQGETK